MTGEPLYPPDEVEAVNRLLTFDPLDAAEKKIGKHWNESEAVQALGFLGHMETTAAKRAVLSAYGDTHFSMKLNEYLEIVVAEGFSEVLRVPFTGREGQDEALCVFWHDDGILLVFDSFSWPDSVNVNGGKFYYNWRPAPDLPNRWHFTSSGHMTADGVWVGDHDCREALRFKIQRLRSAGEFVKPWVEKGWLWLRHYAEKGDGPHDDRVALLPPDVRAGMGLP